MILGHPYSLLGNVRISTIRNHSLCSAGSFHDLMWHCDVWDVKRGINVLVNLMTHVGISTLALECWILSVGFLMWSLLLYFPLRKRYKTLSCSFPGEDPGCAKVRKINMCYCFPRGNPKDNGDWESIWSCLELNISKNLAIYPMVI